MKIVASIRKVFVLIAIAGTLGVSLTSCHREGCPNKITQATSPFMEPAS